MPFNIDESRPYIDAFDCPTEARPGETFSVTVTVGNDSEILAPQSGTCQSGILGSNVAWRNPLRITVDGTTVAEETVCLDASSGTRDVTFRLTLTEGTRRVTAQVLKVPEQTVEEERARSVTVAPGARDPATPTPGDRLTAFLERIASAVGGTTQQVAFGMILAAVLFVVI